MREALNVRTAPTGVTGVVAPVVFVPGFGHAERGWDLLRRHLGRAGFVDVGGFSDVGTRGDIPHRAERLAHHVDTLRTLTGADRVHLVGHHVGGVVARYFVQLLGGDTIVDTVVTIGSAHAGSRLTPVGLGPAAGQLRPGSNVLRHLEESTRPLRVRWISYFSEHDLFVQPTASAVLTDARLRATNVLVADHGHLSLILPTVVARSVAHQLGAAEGLPGFGAPVVALPGAVVRLDEAEGDGPSPAAIARSKALHPSNYRRGVDSSKLMRLEKPVGADP